MKVLLSHPTGNANVREAAKGMKKAGFLAVFYTSIAVFPRSILYNLGAIRPLSELRRRIFDSSIEENTKTNPWHELGRLIFSKIGFYKMIEHETGIFCIDTVYQNMDKYVANKLAFIKKRKKITAVYAYEDGAEYSFVKAKTLGIECIYDLPIGYWRTARKLLTIEKENRPDWAPTLTGFRDSEKKLKRKDHELQLADRIFVASSFTAQTLQDYPYKLSHITVIPYGFPSVVQNRIYEPIVGRKIKLLFVGGLSQRKGIANLFEAIEGMEELVDLTIVGHKSVSDCKALNCALEKHNWIPSLPHNEILLLMQKQDLFVFPSLFEGFGLVITEAMSQGTPVITTNRTAGPDLIVHGENGWIVEAGSTVSLKKQLEAIIQNRNCIQKAGEAAMNTARNRPWDVYGRELAASIQNFNK